MSIKQKLTGDYTPNGYKDGIKDGKKGKPKSHFGTFKRSLINYVWQSDNAIDSYSSGYNTGYTDGLRVKYDIYSSQTGGIMNSLAQQLGFLEQAKGAIKHNKNILDGARDQYGNQVNAMHNADFLKEYADELAERKDRLSRKTDDVIDELDRQLKMMEDFQDSIQRMINDAKG